MPATTEPSPAPAPVRRDARLDPARDGLTDPDEVWRVAFDDGMFRTRYIKLYDDPGTGGSLCIVSKLPDGQEAFINFIPMNDLPDEDADARVDAQRIGSLLFRRR